MSINEANDYQRPPGTPEPEGRTATRSPFPGWMRNMSNGWSGRWSGRGLRAAGINHRYDKWAAAEKAQAEADKQESQHED